MNQDNKKQHNNPKNKVEKKPYVSPVDRLKDGAILKTTAEQIEKLFDEYEGLAEMEDQHGVQLKDLVKDGSPITGIHVAIQKFKLFNPDKSFKEIIVWAPTDHEGFLSTAKYAEDARATKSSDRNKYQHLSFLGKNIKKAFSEETITDDTDILVCGFINTYIKKNEDGSNYSLGDNIFYEMYVEPSKLSKKLNILKIKRNLKLSPKPEKK